jgi:4-aminobutyrate aminotransferase/(S)-3-amino-2-methylpropionate transaminase
VLDIFEEEELVARSVTIGHTIRARMLEWQARWRQIGDVRGLGAMLAIELVTDPEGKAPAPALAGRVVEEAMSRGLLLLRAGVYGNCIRVLCPLTTADAELDEALAVWEDALATVLAEPGSRRELEREP